MNSLDFITPEWPAAENIGTVITTRKGGVSCREFASLNLALHVGDDRAAVITNRELVKLAAGDNLQWQWLQQVHGRVVHRAQQAGEELQGDALVTSVPGIVCCVVAADCLPILLCNHAGTEVAAVHGGWRGLAAGILNATVEFMSSPPKSLMAWLGPAIGACHYEVGTDVRAQIMIGDDSPQMTAQFTAVGNGKYFADLSGIARVQLLKAGIEQIYGGQYCTYSDPDRFFSYRRDGITGRNLNAIYLHS